MSSSTNKKVRVLRFDREAVAGFVHPQTFQTSDGVEMLSRDGNILRLPYREVKVLCFVHDFEENLPELNNRIFGSRPKSSGLWVRMVFRDNGLMDGLLPNSLLDLGPYGFTLTPPDLAVTPQRIFVPKAALRSLHVIAVVGGSLSRGKKADERQISIFEQS